MIIWAENIFCCTVIQLYGSMKKLNGLGFFIWINILILSSQKSKQKDRYGKSHYRWNYFPHCKPVPVMKTGFSLCTFSHREKPVSISWDPCNENRFFPVGKKYTGKSLFWPCTDPVRDCSVVLVVKETIQGEETIQWRKLYEEIR